MRYDETHSLIQHALSVKSSFVHSKTQHKQTSVIRSEAQFFFTKLLAVKTFNRNIMLPSLLQGQCVRLNWKSVVFLMMSLILSHIRITQSSVNSNNPEVTPTKLEKISSDTDRSAVTINSNSKSSSDTSHCPNDTLCTDLPNSCLQCTYNPQCVYGAEINVTCLPKTNVNCHVDKLKTANQNEIKRSMICRYCYQTERWEHSCEQKGGCNSIDSQYKTNCTVHPELLCMGHRTFMKKIPCNWTQGYRWATTLIVSITLGGFGADRFFLGHWQEGIGKLFSFGGLGVWTLIDVLLISLHYLGPADGSLYI